MEAKKGEVLNQLAIISDLLENINLESTSKTVLIDMSKPEFDKIYQVAAEKTKLDIPINGNVFTIKIGEIDFVLSTNSA